jgi:hypothetical protein
MSGLVACGGTELAPPVSSLDASGGQAGTGGNTGTTLTAGTTSSATGSATTSGTSGTSVSAGTGGAGGGGAGGTSGAGGLAGSGGAPDRDAGASDGALPEANGFDAGRFDASDGSTVDVPISDGGIPKCTPLPDGTGHVVFQTSGGLTVDDRIGNDATCDSAWTADSGLVLSFFVPVPVGDAGGNPTGILSVRAPGSRPGVTTASEPATLNMLMTGHIWESSSCTLSLTGNELVGGGPAYKITGSVTCAGPVPEVFGREALVLVKFEFVASATPN